jgi:hypothetical protein
VLRFVWLGLQGDWSCEKQTQPGHAQKRSQLAVHLCRRICESQWFWAGGQVVVVGFCTSMELTSCLCPCLWIMPYEPSLARALVAHERAVRRGPDPVCLGVFEVGSRVALKLQMPVGLAGWVQLYVW